MNCKQGDLAIIVRSEAGNEGKIVRCIRFLGDRLWISKDGSIKSSPTWEINALLPSWNGDVDPRKLLQDEVLRPLRDNDGEDEMLRIAGKPQKVTA